MNEFLSTRQVIEILKVDRITIYRMLSDGRLKGVKIGQQWRFSREEVERLLGTAPAEPKEPAPNPTANFPTHCVQTVQELFSDMSQVSAVVLDLDGNPLTAVSHPTRFHRLLMETPEGEAECRSTWRSFAQQASAGVHQHTCSAGWSYVTAPIVDGEQAIGVFLTGPYAKGAPEATGDADRLRSLASDCGVRFEALQEAAREIPVMASDGSTPLIAWSTSAARSIESILRERTGFLSRLQKIANLSQIS